MSDDQGLVSPPADVVPQTPVVDVPNPVEPGPVELPSPMSIEAPKEPEPEPPKEPDVDVLADEEGESEEKGERKKIPGSQKLKRKLQLIESDFEAERQARVELERRLAQLSTPQNPQGKPGIDREPTEADFPGDYFAYQDARTAWITAQAVDRQFAKLQQNQQDTQAQRQRRESIIERQEAYEESASSARERIPDFDKTIASATDVKITNPEFIDEIMSSEKSALIQYYLAKNPDRARELNGMQGKELAREVGRLEQRVHLPQAKKATEAAPPPTNIRGGSAPPFDLHTAAKSNLNAYIEFRNKEEAAARKRG